MLACGVSPDRLSISPNTLRRRMAAPIFGTSSGKGSAIVVAAAARGAGAGHDPPVKELPLPSWGSSPVPRPSSARVQALLNEFGLNDVKLTLGRYPPKSIQREAVTVTQ